jgi:SAM-dependent methyltransferase
MTSTPNCLVCGNGRDNLRLDSRRGVPVFQNVTLSAVEEAKAFPRGDLEILCCSNCSFIWNEAFDPSVVAYGEHYDNDVSRSRYYLEHLNAIADKVLRSVPAAMPIHLVEVGCGSGDFLKLVAERAAGRCVSATGFDPSLSAAPLPKPIVAYKERFGPDSLARVPANASVICSRHTIEHVSDPNAFMATLAAPAIANDIPLFLEAPNADWTLRHLAFQDFSYERFSLFNPRSMSTLLQAHGLDCRIEDVYDGQYMWVEAHRAERVRSPSEAPTSGADRLQLALGYVQARDKLFAQWRAYVERRAKQGPVAVWGASSKGVTFAYLLARAGDAPIDYAVDLNPAKQGRFMPVTAVPIVAPETAMNQGAKTVLIMNPNYKSEILMVAAQMGWNPEFAVLDSK